MTIKYFIARPLSQYKKLKDEYFKECVAFYSIIHELKKNKYHYGFKMEVYQKFHYYIPCIVRKNPDYFKIFKQYLPSLGKATLSYGFLKYLLYIRAINEIKYIPDYFIDKHKDSLDWTAITKKIELTDENIEKYAQYLNWTVVSSKIKLTEENVEKYAQYFDWYVISERDYIEEHIITKYPHKLDWLSILRNKNQLILYVHKKGIVVFDYDYNIRVNIKPYISTISPKKLKKYGNDEYLKDCNFV